ELAQGRDLGGAGHLGWAVGPPSGRGAGRSDQSALLVEPQGLGGNTEPPGGFGRAEKLGGRAHESPRCRLTAVLIGAAPGARSTGVQAVMISQPSSLSTAAEAKPSLRQSGTGSTPSRALSQNVMILP